MNTPETRLICRGTRVTVLRSEFPSRRNASRGSCAACLPSAFFHDRKRLANYTNLSKITRQHYGIGQVTCIKRYFHIAADDAVLGLE